MTWSQIIVKFVDEIPKDLSSNVTWLHFYSVSWNIEKNYSSSVRSWNLGGHPILIESSVLEIFNLDLRWYLNQKVAQRRLVETKSFIGFHCIWFMTAISIRISKTLSSTVKVSSKNKHPKICFFVIGCPLFIFVRRFFWNDNCVSLWLHLN